MVIYPSAIFRRINLIIVGAAVWALLGILLFGAPVLAAISQGYTAKEKLSPGALVSIESSKNSVTAADTTNSNGLLGVVVDDGKSVLEINSRQELVQVATSGSASLFVSDLNGEIKAGDQIAPSPIKGVGMKASENGKVVGVAQGEFKSGSKSLESTTVTTKEGEKKTARIGSIPVNVQVVYYTVPPKTAVPTFLQQFADSVAGKPVPAAKLILVAAILFVALSVVALLLFSAVRGALISIGRNPLAQKSIYKGMFQVISASLVIMVVAVAGSYLVLNY